MLLSLVGELVANRSSGSILRCEGRMFAANSRCFGSVTLDCGVGLRRGVGSC